MFKFMNFNHLSSKNKSNVYEIKKLFKDIEHISKTFLEYIKLTKKESSENHYLIKENIELLHNKFSKIENLLREYKEREDKDSDNILEYSFSDMLEMTEEELKDLKKQELTYQKMYVWLELYFLKIRELQEAIFKYFSGNYSSKTIDKFIKDINYLYRQIQVVYKVINKDSYPEGSYLNKIKTKTFIKPSRRKIQKISKIWNSPKVWKTPKIRTLPKVWNASGVDTFIKKEEKSLRELILEASEDVLK